MSARPDKEKRTQHPKTVTYFPAQHSDGWRVEMTQGARIVRRLSVDTKEEAIEGAKALLREWPRSVFELGVLAHVHAWWDDGWHYSRERREGTTPARLLDDMGEVVLEVRSAGAVRVVRGARTHPSDGGRCG